MTVGILFSRCRKRDTLAPALEDILITPLWQIASPSWWRSFHISPVCRLLGLSDIARTSDKSRVLALSRRLFCRPCRVIFCCQGATGRLRLVCVDDTAVWIRDRASLGWIVSNENAWRFGIDLLSPLSLWKAASTLSAFARLGFEGFHPVPQGQCHYNSANVLCQVFCFDRQQVIGLCRCPVDNAYTTPFFAIRQAVFSGFFKSALIPVFSRVRGEWIMS